MSAAIEVTSIIKQFKGDAALQGIDLTVAQRSVHAIIGPNGAGKSTLLRLMANLLRPTSGDIRIYGQSVNDNPYLRQSVCYVGADTQIYPTFKVEQVLRYSRLLYEHWDDKRCQKMLNAWNLPTNKRISQLSLGMKMKLKLLIALASMPKVLLLDEALSGIDPASKYQINDMLMQEVALRDVTIMTASHQLAEVEQIADTLSVLAHGRIIATRLVDELRKDIFEIQALTPVHHDAVLENETIMLTQQDGRRLTLLVEGDPSPIKAILAQQGNTVIDVAPAPIERWLRALLAKEGTVSERITLSEGTAI